MKSSREMDAFVALGNELRRSGTGVPSQLEIDEVASRLSQEEHEALRGRSHFTGAFDYPDGWGPVPSEPKATVKSAAKWGTHPGATVDDVPSIAKHIRSWTDATNPGTVEISATLLFAIGTAIESMKTPEAVVVPVKAEPTMAAATLVRYEWRAIKKNYADDALKLNPLFDDGWELHDVDGPTFLLKRQVKP